MSGSCREMGKRLPTGVQIPTPRECGKASSLQGMSCLQKQANLQGGKETKGNNGGKPESMDEIVSEEH